MCGSSFSRIPDVTRHIKQNQCRKAPTATSPPTVTSRKHVLSAHYEETPSQRLRTISPTRSHAEVGHHTVPDVVSCKMTVVVPELDHTDEKLDAPVHMLPQDGYDDGMAAGNLIISDANNSSPTVGVDLINGDTPDDSNLHQVQGGAETSPSTGFSGAEIVTLPAQETPGADDSGEIQMLPITSHEEAVSNVDSVESITHRLSRTSLEVQASKQKRSSFAFSVASVCSATSQWTLPSVRSFFTNPSLRHLAVSQISNPSIRSSNMSHWRASTVPSEMPAPMLEQIDEELVYSRGFGGRLERYMPLRKPRADQQALHERLRSAVDTNRLREVVTILANSRGIINVNRPDESGFTPLLEAARHGHESIVAVLLEQKGIDVHHRDNRGSTALLWAQRQGHTKIVGRLEAYLSSAGNTRGQQDQTVDSGGICCAMLALHPKPSARATSASSEDQRSLWEACENGDITKVKKLVKDAKFDINCRDYHSRTPLSIAASHGYHNIVSWLLGYCKANPSIPDADGATALTWAASQGHTRIVQLLLRHEETASRNDAIITASMALAHKNGHEEIVKMLMLV
jgi:ankyrin repeat protein